MPVAFVTFDAAIKVSDALKAGLWDVAFLAIDPARAEEIAFTAPYVIIEGTYMVAEASPLKDVGDVDRDGIRVSAGKGSAYDLFLTRTLKHAKIVRAPTSPEAIETFVAQKLDAAAGVRQPLVQFADSHPGYRVMDGRFMAIEQAMGTPKGRPAGLAFLHAFVEEMKASGFVAKALDRSGQVDAVVAPAAQAAEVRRHGQASPAARRSPRPRHRRQANEPRKARTAAQRGVREGESAWTRTGVSRSQARRGAADRHGRGPRHRGRVRAGAGPRLPRSHPPAARRPGQVERRAAT